MAGIVKLDKCTSSKVGNIESVQSASTLDNGSVVNLGALVAGTTEVYTVAVPATATLATEEALLVYSPEVMYIPGQELKDFTNPVNQPARAYHLTVGDIITLADISFDGTSVVGQFLIPQNASVRLVASATNSGNRLALKVISKDTFGYTGTGFAKNASTTVRVVNC